MAHKKPSLLYLLQLRSPLYSLTGVPKDQSESLLHAESRSRGRPLPKALEILFSYYFLGRHWKVATFLTLLQKLPRRHLLSLLCIPFCPLLGAGGIENWTAIMIINQPHEYTNFQFLEWKPFMKLSAVSSYSGLLYSDCLVKPCLEWDIHQHCSVLKCLFEGKKGAPKVTSTTTKRAVGSKKTASRSRLSIVELDES